MLFRSHVVALGCIYLASLLTSYEQTPSSDRPDIAVSNQIIAQLDKPGAWERRFQAHVEDLEGLGDCLTFHLVEIDCASQRLHLR